MARYLINDWIMCMAINKTAFLLSALSAAVFSMSAHAGVVNDGNGNEAYDTAEECDAAVQAGTAKFYQPSTLKRPLRLKGEATVRTAVLLDLGSEYKLGACDVGVGRKNNRNGVAKVLQGKYVPYSPNMPINLYEDSSGVAVRASMAKCDNRFSDNRPRPVPIPVVAPPAPPPVVVAPPPQKAPAPAPVAAPAPPPPVTGPYVFGTLGVLRDLIGNPAINGIAQYDDHDTQPALQLGAGYQFSPLLGAEAFVQGGSGFEFENGASYKTRALGLRGTLGQDLGSAARIFGKLGVARVTHSGDTPSQSQTRPTLGAGMLFKFNNNLALRGDFDHYLKKSGGPAPQWKALNYLGVGLQYSFTR